MNKSQVIFSQTLPSPRAFPTETVLFYDSVLVKNKKLSGWLKKFPNRIALSAGESLKSLDSLERALKKLEALDVPKTVSLTFVAVGGGSVGDFVGFLASIYWRGRDLIHIPSTWLAAIDSSHGGKNGLNWGSEKNQLGTFYPAQKVYISRPLLETQPWERLHEALGEVIKTALICDAQLFKFLEKNIFKLNAKTIFKVLPKLIKNKYKIVEKDPLEKNGARRVLNLGHTMGHVLESHYGWPHGFSVMLGLLFSVRWSYHLKYMDEKNYIQISNLIEDIWPEQKLSDDLAGLTAATIEKKILKDKKRVSKNEIDFIFIQKIGKVARRRVKLPDLLDEVKRQTTEY